MSWISSVAEAISSLFCRSSEAQELKIKLKHAKKSDKEFWRNRLKSIFAEAALPELLFMRSLVDSNNEAQELQFNIDFQREVKIGGVKEKLYQIVGYNKHIDERWASEEASYPMVRITVPVFKQFKKQFNKYGRPRIPDMKAGENK